jgi:hypothetical protein
MSGLSTDPGLARGQVIHTPGSAGRGHRWRALSKPSPTPQTVLGWLPWSTELVVPRLTSPHFKMGTVSGTPVPSWMERPPHGRLVAKLLARRPLRRSYPVRSGGLRNHFAPGRSSRTVNGVIPVRLGSPTPSVKTLFGEEAHRRRLLAASFAEGRCELGHGRCSLVGGSTVRCGRQAAAGCTYTRAAFQKVRPWRSKRAANGCIPRLLDGTTRGRRRPTFRHNRSRK